MKNTNSRPNIVYIHNDHQAYYRWGWDGGMAPKRPHFDRLAADGALFNRAYCATPLCGPTRRSLLTGLYPHAHKQHHNYTDPPYDHEVYLNTLAKTGYQNYYFGKWHAGPGAAAEHSCQGFSESGYGNPYIRPEYHDYLKMRNLPEAVHHIERYFDIPIIREQGDFTDIEEGKDYQCKSFWCGEHAIGLTTTPKETHESFFLANLACDQLDRIAENREKGDTKPFSLRLDFWGPHQPHFPTQEFLDIYPEGDDFDVPEYGSYRSMLEGKPQAYFRERSSPFGKNDLIIQPCPVPWNEWKTIVRYCYAHITMVDAAGGLVLNKLKELGLDKNTLIIWTTDHGDALASHGGHFDKGSFMSEEVLRIPLAIKWEGKIPAGQVCNDPINSVDYPVTMLDAAGTAFSEPVHGQSLLPLIMPERAAERSTQHREDTMCQTYGHGYGDELISRVLIWEDWKYVATKDKMSELYNLKDDPFELVNLIDNKDKAEILAEMQRRLAGWQTRTKDAEKVM